MQNKKTITLSLLTAAMIFSFATIGSVTAQKAELPGEKIPDDNVTKSDEKKLIKAKLKEKITELSKKDHAQKSSGMNYTADEYGIPYNMAYEDGDGRLVVGIDAKKAIEFQRQYSEKDVKADLNTDVELDVRYYIFQRQADIRGGDAMAHNGNLSTITVIKNGKIVTTGHAFEKGDIVIVGLAGGVGCQEVKIVKDDNKNNDYADASYGTDTNANPGCNNNYLNDTIHYNGRYYDVVYGTAGDIVKNKAIKIAGAKTTSSGHILDTDSTVKFDGGLVLNDQAIGNYASTQGDSGAPIFSINSQSSVTLLGQHVGWACEIDLHSGTQYGYWCNANQSSKLKIFSPWDQVATHLGI